MLFIFFNTIRKNNSRVTHDFIYVLAKMNKTSVKLVLRKYFTHYILVACSSSSFTQCVIIFFDVRNILYYIIYSSKVIRDKLKYKLTRVWILLSSTDVSNTSFT